MKVIIVLLVTACIAKMINLFDYYITKLPIKEEKEHPFYITKNIYKDS